MHATDIVIHVDPDTPLGHALDAHPWEPIVLVRGKRRYRLVPEDPQDDLDQERLRETLGKVAGTFTPEYAEQFKQELYRREEEHTQNPHLP
ncbi:MAG: hypothetical protein KC442_01400 [Thermomicrobiales bacterium]|nr:hypothetical protein [Thermomicrobiales bacterium]